MVGRADLSHVQNYICRKGTPLVLVLRGLVQNLAIGRHGFTAGRIVLT
jgi:hypothetical protein